MGFSIGRVWYKTYCQVKCLDKKGINKKRFQNKIPEIDWFKGLISHNREYLNERMAENIKQSRAAISIAIITTYFEELKISLEGKTPECIKQCVIK